MKKIIHTLLLGMVIFSFSSCGEQNIPIPEEKADITSTVTVTEAATTTAVTTSVPVTSESSATSLVTSSVTVSAVSETSADSVMETADKTELPVNTDSSAEHSETKTESKITVTRQNDVSEEEKIQTLPEETTVTEATTTVNDVIINDDGSIDLPEVFF